MGVRYLNSVLTQSCSKNAIHRINVSDLSNKTIAIDISIYMYKYLGEGTLIDSMIIMLSIFKKCNIHTIFVFDGKPPPEKKHIIKERQTKKKQAEERYTIAMLTGDEEEAKTLQKQVVRINGYHISSVKELITSFGAEYCDAIGEADEVCAKLVLSGVAWACLTEDMDMFLYGCPRILRQFHLQNETMILHDLPHIINDLELESVEQFRQIVISTGLSDYSSVSNTNAPCFRTLKDALNKRQILTDNSNSSNTCCMYDYSISDVSIPPILGKGGDAMSGSIPIKDILHKNGIIMI